jgi:hypothetical protein
MKFMTITDEITIIANQLANQGKKPTVALVKTRLSKSVPLPQIINALKTWQHNPENTVLSVQNNKEINENKTSTSADIEQAIDQAIAPLRNELAEIKLLLKTLMNAK